MASVFENVLGYLRPKSQLTPAGRQPQNKEDVDVGHCEANDEDDTDWVYDIEDQDDWQIVRKMDDEDKSEADNDADCLDDGDQTLELDDEVCGMEDVENWHGCRTKSWQKSWYLAPPSCFTRSAPSPSTNPLENLLIEHPSMSVYLLPIAAASSTRQGSLCRSAPPIIMEQTLAGYYTPPTPPVVEPLRHHQRDQSPATPANPPRPTSHKRKRRVRARKAELALAAGSPNTTTAAPVATDTTHRELGSVATVEELNKQEQNEEKDLRTSKKTLAKNQLQRTNLLTEVNVPKKTTSRNGKYRCLH